MQTTSNMEILSIATRPTTTPFPALNEEERSILSRIIYLTPPNTNNFNVLLSPYENTLRRSRIDPKIDDKYYTLLLKLSLIPGKDWKQKWARVESDQPTSSAVVSQQQQPAIPVNPSTSHPRKIIEKVHASSYDEEDRGALIKNFRPPPVNHQKADRRPQKSVHFLPSGVVENPRKEINDQPERDISSPVELQSEIIPSKMTLLIDPIDVKARKFRRHQLLSRILTKWMHSIIYWNTLNSEAHSARRILDISARYQTWTRKFRNREDRLKSVDTTYNTRLMSLHLDQWRRLTVSRRIQKRSLALRNAYRKTKGTRERNLCRQVLIIWANHIKSTRFYGSSTRQLIHRSLSHWYQKLQYLSHLSSASNNLLSALNSAHRHQIFSQWHQETLLRIKLQKALNNRDSQSKHEFFLDWKIRVTHIRQSKLFFLKSRFHTLLKAGQKFRSRQRTLELSEKTVLAFRSSNTQLHVLRHWIICGRGLLFSSFMRTRVLRLHFKRWRRRMTYVHHDLPHLQNQFTVESTLNLANRHLQHWVQRHHKITQQSTHAHIFYHWLLIRQSFLTWRVHYAKLQPLHLQATSTRVRFLKERVLLVWKRRIQKIKVNLWRQQKRLTRLRGHFSSWRLLVQKQRRLSICFLSFDQSSNKRHYTYAFSRWRAHFSLTTRNEHIAAEFARKNLIQSFWKIWIGRYDGIRVLDQESSMVVQRRNQTEQTDLLSYWVTKTRTKIAHNLKLAQFSHRHNRSLMFFLWERWRDQVRERQLKPLVQKFIDIRDINRKDYYFNQKWKDKSKLLFLREASNRSLKTKTLKNWSNLIKFNDKILIHNQIINRRILTFYFHIWFKKYLDLKTFRIINRFKNNVRIADPPRAARNGRRWNNRVVLPQDDYTTTISITTTSSDEI